MGVPFQEVVSLKISLTVGALKGKTFTSRRSFAHSKIYMNLVKAYPFRGIPPRQLGLAIVEVKVDPSAGMDLYFEDSPLTHYPFLLPLSRCSQVLLPHMIFLLT